MTFESRSRASSRSTARAAEESAAHARAFEAIESVERTELPFHFAPARGILNAVVIGAGAWIIIFAAVTLTRSVFFS
jgi:hypothetical protein